MNQQRLHFFDNIRTLLICLVVMVHAAVTYGGEGGWYYYEATESETVVVILTLFNAVCQSFFMSLLFLIAGFFTSASLNHAKSDDFCVSRLMRLGIPLLFFYLVLGPFTVWFSNQLDGTNEFEYSQTLHSGPMWFAQALLIFTGMYVLFRRWLVTTFASISVPKAFWPATLLYILLLWLVTVYLRNHWPIGEGIAGMQLGSFGHYSLMYIIGIWLYLQPWTDLIERIKIAPLMTSVAMGIFMLPVAMVLGVDPERGFEFFMGGLHWQALLYAGWESAMCVLLSLLVVRIFWQLRDFEHPLLKPMAQGNYGVYIIHPPILLLASWLLFGIAWHPLIKFIVASAVTLVICFPLAYLIRKLPFMQRIL